MADTAATSRRHILWLLAVMAILWFANLDYRHLAQPDEGRYAEIPREMLASGDWVTPRLNGLKYFEKPALQYWATGVAFQLFGEHEWSARLWTALTGFLGILLAQAAHGQRARRLACVVQTPRLFAAHAPPSCSTTPARTPCV